MCRWLLVLIAALVMLPCAGTALARGKPSLMTVLNTLSSESEAELSEGAAARFKDWGDKAVPHLRHFAADRHYEKLARPIVAALWVIGTHKAAKLYVSILKNKKLTQLWYQAYSGLTLEPRTEPLVKHLLRNTGFKNYLSGAAGGPDAGMFLRIVRGQRMKNQLTLVRRLFKHEKLAIRELAAQTFEVITGKPAHIVRPALAFPVEDLVSELVGTPEELPRLGRKTAGLLHFARWVDDLPRFLYGWREESPVPKTPTRLRIASGGFQTFETLDLPAWSSNLLVVKPPIGKRRLVVRNFRPKERTFEIVCLDHTGKALWTFTSPSEAGGKLAILYGPTGALGVGMATGRSDGLIGIDLAGKELWDHQTGGYAIALSSTPESPGLLLEVGLLSHQFLTHTDSTCSTSMVVKESESGIDPDDGILFPSKAGRPAAILSGHTLGDGRPTLRREDHTGKVVWEAILPSTVTELAMLTAEGCRRHFVATTFEGRLLVFDEDGTLRWDGALPPFTGAFRWVGTALAVGEYALGRYAVACRVGHGSFWLPLDIAKLR